MVDSLGMALIREAQLRKKLTAMEEFEPTPDKINALPDALRRYIHDLETRCDPAGEVAALTLTRDQNEQLVAMVENIKKSSPMDLQAELVRIKKEVKHQWTDGPDGSGYHCHRCGISKCDDHACYDTCVSHLRRRMRNGLHSIVYGLETLHEFQMNKKPAAKTDDTPCPNCDARVEYDLPLDDDHLVKCWCCNSPFEVTI